MRGRLIARSRSPWAILIVIAISAPVMADEPSAKRFARFRGDDGEAFGLVEGDRIRQIDGDLFGTWKATDKLLPLSAVTLLAPSPRPTQVLALAGNYKSHLGAGDIVTTVTTTTKITTNPQTGKSETESTSKVDTEKPGEIPTKFQMPQLFFKSPSSVIGTGDDIVIPRGTDDVHFEGELVIVIGKQAKNADERKALECILGVTCGNDVSARDWQKNDVQWWRAKGCDTFGPIGPYIVSGINYDDLRLVLRVNGKTMQDERTSQLIQNVPKIVSFVSSHITLHPGDLIFTGTPGKTSAIRPGDKVEVEIEGIGTLTNSVVAASPTAARSK